MNTLVAMIKSVFLIESFNLRSLFKKYFIFYHRHNSNKTIDSVDIFTELFHYASQFPTYVAGVPEKYFVDLLNLDIKDVI